MFIHYKNTELRLVRIPYLQIHKIFYCDITLQWSIAIVLNFLHLLLQKHGEYMEILLSWFFYDVTGIDSRIAGCR